MLYHRPVYTLLLYGVNNTNPTLHIATLHSGYHGNQTVVAPAENNLGLLLMKKY